MVVEDLREPSEPWNSEIAKDELPLTDEKPWRSENPFRRYAREEGGSLDCDAMADVFDEGGQSRENGILGWLWEDCIEHFQGYPKKRIDCYQCRQALRQGFGE